ncbi:hypothetical protein KHS38_12345 [Mucilaginibacter sp. Bleaf8]|uniref:DUF5723 family protein n=1 Tax=Mucilaginibacter sp. Bleaf8 TaxID=2834430 RepID=UPI001BCEB3D0|nr:DUF5723 family protein [Mucilaginibacter sp. Bleaf8]MBS7565194.1 hypothetical protein [Mucilaginibacter sp. Bleaf8]
MNKFFLCLLLTACSITAFAQKFSQYNTGTLYESFENPSQAVFKQDTTRTIAFNFFVPNVNTFVYLKGNAQTTLKSRLFLSGYDTQNLQIGQTQPNHILANANIYLFMFKFLSNQNGDQELGASMQIKGNGRGNFTDETFALFNGSEAFETDRPYNNIFNSNGYYESYMQLSLTYREKVTKDLSLGFKLSGLMGIAYDRISVNESSIQFDPSGNNADWYMRGSYSSSYELGQFNRRLISNAYKNPGAAISIGANYTAPGNIQIQANLKDFGFIHWSNQFRTYRFGTFGNSTLLTGLLTNSRESNVFTGLANLVQEMPEQHARTLPIEGRAELAVSRKFAGEKLSYTPTAIISKNVYHPGATAALVNHIQFGPMVLTATGAMDNYVTSIGGQLMYQAPNVEFYIGSEQLTQTGNLYRSNNGNAAAVEKNMPYSGGSIFVGFSVKFGKRFERWRNSSYTPTGGGSGPLGRLWTKMFAN